MKKLQYLLLITVLITFCFACGKKNHDDSKEIAKEQNEEKFDSTSIKKDTEFVVKAADGGMLEVELGKLAVANASDGEVKKLGQTMIDDHSKANEELKALAQQKNISIPAALSDKSQKIYEDLAKKNGADFDKEYADQMVKDHKKDVDEFKKEAEKGEDNEIRSWASGKVSVLEHHLMMAENAKKVVDNKKK